METLTEAVDVLDQCRAHDCDAPTADDGAEAGFCGSCADAVARAREAADEATEYHADWVAAAELIAKAFTAMTDAVERMDTLRCHRNDRAAEYVPDDVADAVREQIILTSRYARRCQQMANPAVKAALEARVLAEATLDDRLEGR